MEFCVLGAWFYHGPPFDVRITLKEKNTSNHGVHMENVVKNAFPDENCNLKERCKAEEEHENEDDFVYKKL